MARSAWTRWTVLLGFALGGFFDGILLHQILQWHHLLSLVPGMADLRVQILWDGYFHALMYGLAALALWGLWRGRGQAVAASATLGALLAGFGAWHVIDGVLSHWLLGIHRVRLDSAFPLAWDLGWMAAFGLVPILIGWRLMQRRERGGPPPAVLVSVLGLVAALGGIWAAQPPAGQPFTTIVFAPGVQPEDVLARAGFSEAQVVWMDPLSQVTVARLEGGNPWALYLSGALLVSGAGTPPGCFNWTKV
ncbi:DUF2243 domain-containing protein [Paracoccus sp. YIM 132242]|uniref:DUF2243 domain-containing protein n=1 Tax=Paracoccus lichenicola TaxID=2665644 RepID=A0A6L6HSM5_9RHOB|nr:DUF2243 domain-containing protein [Paracoccus lichenicola]MTE01233.1 DUF2243 domain-containing protein [Paracoccus lichenicola]